MGEVREACNFCTCSTWEASTGQSSPFAMWGIYLEIVFCVAWKIRFTARLAFGVNVDALLPRLKTHSHTLTNVVLGFSRAALSQGCCKKKNLLPPTHTTLLEHPQKWPCFPGSSAALTSLVVDRVFTAAERRANAARRSHRRYPPAECDGGASGVGTSTAEVHSLTAR